MTDATARLNAAIKGMFPELLGLTLVSAEPERVVADLFVRDDLCTVPGILHGGAIMAFADTLGAMATVLNFDDPAKGTTTLESKTNFIGAGRAGTTIRGECVPIHRGGRTMVWQTTVRNPDGSLVAVVTQTQMVLEARRSPGDQVAALFAAMAPEERNAALAALQAQFGDDAGSRS